LTLLLLAVDPPGPSYGLVLLLSVGQKLLRLLPLWDA